MVLKLESGAAYDLYDVEATRRIEHAGQLHLPAHTLMQRAGLATARLSLAIAPHATRIWLACGPGNNGGDGLEAAMHLKRLGKSPVVTWLGSPEKCPADTAASLVRAQSEGVCFADAPVGEFDIQIDALLGIGASAREPSGRMGEWIDLINQRRAPTLAIDVPSGLNADTGRASSRHVRANHTLSLLTLKPGLFTAQGRDASGQVWFDSLDICQEGTDLVAATARLLGAPGKFERPHDSHKGTYGDVAIVGGGQGMVGAAILAATAALQTGAGRVYVALLEDPSACRVDPLRPELMFRQPDTLDFSSMAVVCGCGGGPSIREHLSRVLTDASRMVLDADALNAIAAYPDLADKLKLASAIPNGAQIVITPHPLEAARLLGSTARQVQHDRLGAAQQLATHFNCTVVLKGSGTIVTHPQQRPMINPTGNARLATAGTGDVLAGMIGAKLAAGLAGFASACQAVYLHGHMADTWCSSRQLTAGTLAFIGNGYPNSETMGSAG